MILKIFNFFSKDFDFKLIYLSRIFKIKFYPSYTKSKFQLLYNVIILKYIYKFKNINISKIKKLFKIKKKQIITYERSGSTYVRKLLDEYLSSINNLNITTDKSLSTNFIKSSEFYNLEKNFFENKNFNRCIFFSRYPFGRISSFLDLNSNYTVLILRDPLEWSYSYLRYKYKTHLYKSNLYNLEIFIDYVLKRNQVMLNSVQYISSEYKNIKILFFEDLIQKPEIILKMIIKRLSINFNKKILLKVITNNKKNKLKKISFYNKRITKLDKNKTYFLNEIKKNKIFKDNIKIFRKIKNSNKKLAKKS
jgi:hypothetical protein